MPWEPIVAFPDDSPRGTRVKKAKLYADEDIEDEIVDALRARNVNIKGAREIAGHRGKDDGFHAAFAFKERRFLITKNGKHYLDDRRVPFNRIYGVIVLEGDFGAESDYIETLLLSSTSWSHTAGSTKARSSGFTVTASPYGS